MAANLRETLHILAEQLPKDPSIDDVIERLRYLRAVEEGKPMTTSPRTVPRRPGEIAQRILDATETLLDYPRTGRVGEAEGSGEWRVDKTPYWLVLSAIREIAY